MINYALDLIPFSRRGSFLLITSGNSSGSPRRLYKTYNARVHNVHEIPFPTDEFFKLALMKGVTEIPIFAIGRMARKQWRGRINCGWK
ncbi:MAG: hypothetical protein WAV05_03010 [Anaerolineales bacterium]